MTNKKTEAFSRKYLLPHLPGWAARGPLLFVLPVDHVLRGVAITRKRLYKTECRLQTFATPLYVPQYFEAFTYGDELDNDLDLAPGKQERAAATVLKAIQGKAKRWLGRRADPAGLAANTHRTKGTENQREAAVYGLIWAGKAGPEPQAMAGPLLEYLEECRADEDWGRGRDEWWNQMYARLQMMLKLASSKKTLPKARAQLEKWTATSVKALKLAEFT